MNPDATINDTNATATPEAITAVNPKSSALRSARQKREMRNLVKRGRVWYFKKMVRGSVAYVSLETEDLELAKAKRDMRQKMAARDELSKIKGPRSGVATIAEVLAEYKKVATVADRIEPATVQANASALKNFVRWGLGTPGVRNDAVDVDKLRTDVLTDELVAKAKTNYVAAAGEDRAAREKRRRGAASWLRQARSVFSNQAMLLYKNLVMPDLKNFLKARIEFDQRVHLPIEENVLRAMDEAMMKLAAGSDVDRALWLVHALHKFCGLRNDEIAEVRPEWFCRAPWGQIFLSVVTRPYHEPKGSQGHVPITHAVAQLLAPFVADLQPQDFLVLPKGTMSDRHDLIYRTHAAWMRQFLPAVLADGQEGYAKAGYELRRWAAQVMETRYGREAAEAFLRHSPKTVAERHYFERWFPWRRVGTDVGIQPEDARGMKENQLANIWVQGADALSGLGKSATMNPRPALSSGV